MTKEKLKSLNFADKKVMNKDKIKYKFRRHFISYNGTKKPFSFGVYRNWILTTNNLLVKRLGEQNLQRYGRYLDESDFNDIPVFNEKPTIKPSVTPSAPPKPTTPTNRTCEQKLGTAKYNNYKQKLDTSWVEYQRFFTVFQVPKNRQPEVKNFWYWLENYSNLQIGEEQKYTLKKVITSILHLQKVLKCEVPFSDLQEKLNKITGEHIAKKNNDKKLADSKKAKQDYRDFKAKKEKELKEIAGDLTPENEKEKFKKFYDEVKKGYEWFEKKYKLKFRTCYSLENFKSLTDFYPFKNVKFENSKFKTLTPCYYKHDLEFELYEKFLKNEAEYYDKTRKVFAMEILEKHLIVDNFDASVVMASMIINSSDMRQKQDYQKNQKNMDLSKDADYIKWSKERNEARGKTQIIKSNFKKLEEIKKNKDYDTYKYNAEEKKFV